ncbi:MAG: hypothetical protein IJM30_12795, partial [Thermoguttaceae bacterium]|nr:hypothetical protein [Thermoguttaceae bacterium]
SIPEPIINQNALRKEFTRMFSEDYQLEAVSRNAVANSEVSNPFGGSLVNSSSVGTAQVVSRELAEMQAQIYLAK